MIRLFCFLLTGFFQFQQISGQSLLNFHCQELNLSKSVALKCDPISEDDPGDLAEAYSYLITYLVEGQSSANKFELHFPSRVGTYHWTKKDDEDKNDSLSAELYYDTNPQVYGYSLQAHAKDFTIQVKRYDESANGSIEGTFSGDMETYITWKHQTVLIPVNGTFHASRTKHIRSECRKYRRSEKEVVNRAIAILDEELLAPLNKLGWVVDSRESGETGQVANNPGPFRPLMICNGFYKLKLKADPNSESAKAVNDSMEYYANQVSENKNDNEKMVASLRNMTRMQAYQNIEIRVLENMPYLKEGTPKKTNDKYIVLHLQQVPFAYQFVSAASNEMDIPKEHTSVFLGEWKDAEMYSKNYVTYPFIHKTSSPYIENIVVEISAPAFIANKIVSSINWANVRKVIVK